MNTMTSAYAAWIHRSITGGNGVSLILIVFFAVVMATIGPTAYVIRAEARDATVDFAPLVETIQSEMATSQIPGMAVAIVKDGEIIFEQGFGVRDLETKALVTPTTVFRIGSTTKILTTIGVMQLVEAGQVNLDDPVEKYIPEFSVNPKITVRQILSHTAGVLDGLSNWNRRDDRALSDFISSLTPNAAFAEPGAVFSYCNACFSTVGLLIERVSGMSYADYMTTKVFSTLGLTRTTLYPNMAMTYPLAVSYMPGDEGWEVARPTPDSVADYPAGYVFSTVEDMARLATFLLNDGSLDGVQILSVKTVQMMKTPVSEIDTLNMGYGLGLSIEEKYGVTMIGHDGHISGYTSYLQTIPSAGLGVIVLDNAYHADPEVVLQATVELLAGVPAGEADVVTDLDTTALIEYAGKYRVAFIQGDEDFLLNIYMEGDKLFIEQPDAPPMELRPLSQDRFGLYFKDRQMDTLAFLRDASGRVAYLMHSGRAYPRIE